jgi:hypothetical protein
VHHHQRERPVACVAQVLGERPAVDAFPVERPAAVVGDPSDDPERDSVSHQVAAVGVDRGAAEMLRVGH